MTAGKTRLEAYRFLIFPGGFLDGDDLGAAQAASIRWKYSTDGNKAPLMRQLTEFMDKGGLILGICNGFQLLVKLGLLPALDGHYLSRQVSLMHNESARFENRWCTLAVDPDSPCVFTRGLSRLYFPVRHGEGRLVAKNDAVMARIREEHLAPVHYADPMTGRPTQAYPENPNGSPDAIAGLTDPTGKVFGLMHHPEAYTHTTNHPGWTCGEQAPLGTRIFENAVTYLRQYG
jgi:phosphoribosylformylglycinamidine synthase